MFHEKIDTIHRLQSMGLSLEQIAQGADMKVDEVRKLYRRERRNAIGFLANR
jgi:hypothetical protein